MLCIGYKRNRFADRRKQQGIFSISGAVGSLLTCQADGLERLF